MSIRWSGDLTAKLGHLDERIKLGMVAAMHQSAPHVESYMKQRAPWTDRTGNARSGLNTSVSIGTNQVTMTLAHGVSYGVFLETRWGGKYAAIRPTLEVAARLVGDSLGKILG